MKRKGLLNVLDLVKPAVADPALVEVYSHFCFTGDTVYASDDHLTIIGPCKTPDVFSLHAGTLHGILKNSRADAVEFQKTAEHVLVKAGKSRIKLPYFEKDQFLFDEPDDKWVIELPIDHKLLHGLEVCLTTSSKDSSQSAFMGVAFNAGDGINFYSTDGDALTHYLLETDNEEELEVSYTMPNDFCHAVLRIGEKAVSPESGGMLYANEDWAVAKFDNGFSVYSQVIESSNKLHSDMIEETLKEREPTFVPVPKGMKEALLRASVIGKKESKPTMLRVGGKKIKMDTESAIGVIKDIVRVKGEHADVEAPVDPEKVLRALTVCDEIAIFDNCTCYRNQDEIFQILGNLVGS